MDKNQAFRTVNDIFVLAHSAASVNQFPLSTFPSMVVNTISRLLLKRPQKASTEGLKKALLLYKVSLFGPTSTHLSQ
jgi:hypothetical protein